MTTSHTFTLICPRCPAKASTSLVLARHLAEYHLLGSAQARQEAMAVIPLPSQISSLPSAPAPVTPEEHHACPKCGTTIACDLAGLFSMEQQATRLKILAGMWRARLNGTVIGHPRRNTFDVAKARTLVQEGMSYQAVAEALGASSSSAVKSQLARERRKAK